MIILKVENSFLIIRRLLKTAHARFETFFFHSRNFDLKKIRYALVAHYQLLIAAAVANDCGRTMNYQTSAFAHPFEMLDLLRAVEI
jgi:hypothetical protein